MAPLPSDETILADDDRLLLSSTSYFNHSFLQRLAANVAKTMVDEAITKYLDIESILSTCPTINLADLGCAVGPNTFVSIQEIIHVMKKLIARSPSPSTSPTPEFLVFFNDLPTNDFNTLFLSLPPQRDYFAAGVPGSFYGRLFPDSSLHYVQVCYALHWMSMVPREVQRKGSPAWNKGKIHYTNAPDEVREAYARQWAEDMGGFLEARAKEIVSGGILVAVMQSIPDGMPYSELANGIMYESMASILLDIAQRGLVKEEDVDGFNLPIYAAPPGEFISVVEKNGCFEIVAMGMTDPSPWLTGDVHIDMAEFVRHIRAAMGGMFLKQFAPLVVDQMFQVLEMKLSMISEQMESAYRDKIQANYVLRRK